MPFNAPQWEYGMVRIWRPWGKVCGDPSSPCRKTAANFVPQSQQFNLAASAVPPAEVPPSFANRRFFLRRFYPLAGELARRVLFVRRSHLAIIRLETPVSPGSRQVAVRGRRQVAAAGISPAGVRLLAQKRGFAPRRPMAATNCPLGRFIHIEQSPRVCRFKSGIRGGIWLAARG